MKRQFQVAVKTHAGPPVEMNAWAAAYVRAFLSIAHHLVAQDGFQDYLSQDAQP
jgi:hypothetical protein